MSIHTKKNSKKDKWVQIRVSEDTKDKLEDLAWAKRISVSKLMLDAVLTNGEVKVLDSKNEELNIKTLVEGIFEFNKIMKFNKGNLRFPEDIDKSKIMEAIRLSQMMK